ncbi:30S ribosomal protein S8 [Patescibacteria group bacterium]|nr:30S ribosomal protein S8 [Patescibacteria group bacterium]
MVDPIADMINRIKNAQAVGKETVEVPFSKIRFEIGKILERTLFVKKVELKNKKSKRSMEITLDYNEGMPKISGVKRISKPGKRMYVSVLKLKKTTRIKSIGIISTSKGLMTVGEARAQGLGGEMLCEIWT